MKPTDPKRTSILEGRATVCFCCRNAFLRADTVTGVDGNRRCKPCHREVMANLKDGPGYVGSEHGTRAYRAK